MMRCSDLVILVLSVTIMISGDGDLSICDSFSVNGYLVIVISDSVTLVILVCSW